MRLLEPSGSVCFRIAALGDVGVAGSTRDRARRDGYESLFAAAAPSLRSADVGFANLELAIGEREWVRPGRSPDFWQDPEVATGLARSGVRVVSLANNHMMDLGPRGLARTREVCEAAGLAVVGAGEDLEAARRPVILMAGGRKVAFGARAVAGEDRAQPGVPGVAPLEAEALSADLKHWRQLADHVVVSVHWGSMYVDYPPPRVLDLWRGIHELADVVLGHHPHVLQGFRRTGRNLTLFSLGDACFNPRAGEVEAQVAAQKRRESGVFTVSWAESPGLDYEPLTLDEDGIPRASGAADAERQAARLNRLSTGLEEAAERFASESAPVLARYEFDMLWAYLRQGRLDRALRLIASVRPRHLPILWQAIRRRSGTA